MGRDPQRWRACRLAAWCGLAGALVWCVPAEARAQSQAGRAEARTCEELRGASFADALQGKIPGVRIVRSGGAASGAATMNVRGVHTLRSNRPVVYVDGVRVTQLRAGNLNSVSLLEFVDPTQVDRIEVVRGPEAAFRYGNDASSGVMHIYTRRAGAPAAQRRCKPD